MRRIEVNGKLRPGVYAKDVILYIIRQLGVKGGVGYAYEYAGDVFDRFSMEERMTVCNMSIEGGARCGYVNPDADDVRRTCAAASTRPTGATWDRAVAYWESMRSRRRRASTTTSSDRRRGHRADRHLGHHARRSRRRVGAPLPDAAQRSPTTSARSIEEAYRYMKLRAGQPIAGTKIDVAFIGSCTNGRFSRLRGGGRAPAASGKQGRAAACGRWSCPARSRCAQR